MSQMKQVDAVHAAITQVLSNAGISFEDGQNVAPLMTAELTAQVNQILFEGFKSGNITLKKEKTENEIKKYIPGLQTNWINKDPRLNGGTHYITKNPGSRAGSTDPQVKALRQLLAKVETEEEKAEIQGYLNDRLSEIQASKPAKAKKAVQIDYSSLPAELVAKYS